MSTRVEPVAAIPRTAPAPAATVEPGVAPPPGSPRFPLVDGVRAIAALSVLLTHTAALAGFNSANRLGAWTARLDSGVAIFFVLSGFLLYRPWVAARLADRPGPRPLAYAKRRAERILPAYWLALTAMGLVLSAEVPGVFGEDWWVYYGLLQSWSIDTVLGGIGVAWSLSVEAAFYVLLPLLAWGMARWLRGRPPTTQVRWELRALATSALVALVVRTAWEVSDRGAVFANTLPGMWSWFAAGMALAVLSAAHGSRPLAERPALLRSAAQRPVLWWAAALGALTVAALACDLPRDFGTPYTTLNLQLQHVLYVTMAVCLVAPAVFADGRASPVARLLAFRPLAWLGLVSYGIFLYHLPLAIQLRPALEWLPGPGYPVYVAVTLASAAGLAALSYYGVERPFLRRGRR